MQDYIERAVSRIHTYMPPKPEQIDYLLQNGCASLGQSAAEYRIHGHKVFGLPDGVNHFSSATLNANARKVQVKTRNVMYQKLAN